jgi:hypothetical protein
MRPLYHMPYRYRYSVRGADEAGLGSAHPQRVIWLLASDAFEFESHPIADCWLFSTQAPIEHLPPYVARVDNLPPLSAAAVSAAIAQAIPPGTRFTSIDYPDDHRRRLMTKPLVIYHGFCPDGFTAAWVAARALGDVELYVGKYGDHPPYELATGRAVYVVDFSYPREQLLLLNDLADSLLVLDHHKTAQAACEGLDFCTFDMQRSGAGITWDHFHPGEARPWIVDYVEDRDLWRFKLPSSEEVSLRVRLTEHTLEAYDQLARRDKLDMYNEARGAKMHLDHYVRDALRNTYDLARLWESEVVRCVNVSYTGVSDVLNGALLAVDKPQPVRIALGWHLSIGDDGVPRLNVSLRSTSDYDCSPFARAYGGGGHAQASGFRLDLDSLLAQRLMRAE